MRRIQVKNHPKDAVEGSFAARKIPIQSPEMHQNEQVISKSSHGRFGSPAPSATPHYFSRQPIQNVDNGSLRLVNTGTLRIGNMDCRPNRASLHSQSLSYFYRKEIQNVNDGERYFENSGITEIGNMK
ncbi:hypothetical protein NE237_027674 [Protea cynaroides]|uniref:Uncharacterized protein n=1 Tax=Protea cynaroides TaxID=273540 RepID=A0A9Q0GMY4_9MAGN|nr:hypothetical protein NE237_027674 [Protea cynaroides]